MSNTANNASKNASNNASSADTDSHSSNTTNSANNPFAGFSLQDGIEFVKQLWGQSQDKHPASQHTAPMPDPAAQPHADTMNLFAFPAALLDEKTLQERIDQLKIVEQWLTFNLSLLRQTIQGMEVQKSTLTAIRQMSEAMNQPNYPHHQPSPTTSPQSTPQKTPQKRKTSATETSKTQSSGSATAHPPLKPSSKPASKTSSKPTAPSFDPTSLVQPSTWLNLAQAQFNKVAQSAAVQHTVEQLADKVMQATKNTMTDAMAKTMTHNLAKTVSATVDQGVAEVKKVIRKRKKTTE
jgi:hypothetical protein